MEEKPSDNVQYQQLLKNSVHRGDGSSEDDNETGWFRGKVFLSLDQEQTYPRVLVAALIKKRDIRILMLLRCSVVCVFSTTMVSDCYHSSCT